MFWLEVMFISTATSASSFVLLVTVLVCVLSPFDRTISTFEDFRGDDDERLFFFAISVILASDFLFSLSNDDELFFGEGEILGLFVDIPKALPRISFLSSKP
jgi:hypothetical protein